MTKEERVREILARLDAEYGTDLACYLTHEDAWQLLVATILSAQCTDARVKAHLARYDRLIGSQSQKNEVIQIRGLKIDRTARRVWINGEEKQFTTKEFDLLTFLAMNPNHVFTKEELFRNIWDMESVGDIATVTVHIKKIRERIEMATSKPQYIETIWGVGYRFKI